MMRSRFVCFPFLCLWAGIGVGLGEGTPGFPQSVASGDPGPGSVVLWTRAELADGDREVSLHLTGEDNLGRVGRGEPLAGENLYAGGPLTARAEHDGCLKIKVGGLQPNRYYYYQFSFQEGGETRRSAVGRTRTAPSPDQDVAVRFAVFNCSDYAGRYLNTYQHLSQTEAGEIHFVLHLGDYIYETAEHPSSPDPLEKRKVEFTRPGEAIDLGGLLSARSLSNYRDIYRTVREDAQLMRAHELFPWVVIWDDHEYSDDHWGEVSTMHSGAADEADADRKRNSERAWMEWIPADVGLSEEGLSIDAESLYPSTRIYRSLNFGRNLDLVLTDSRTYRPDHLIPEDAYPGTVLMDEAETRQVFETVFGEGSFAAARGLFDPYLDLAGDHPYFGREGASAAAPVPEFAGTPFQGSTFQQAMGAAVQQQFLSETAGLPEGAAPSATPQEYAARALSGRVSATWINILFGALGFPDPIPEAYMATLERGISARILGKTSLFAQFGSRYQVVDATFQLYSLFQYSLHSLSQGALGNGQDFLGPQQQQFLQAALQESVLGGRTWRVVASSIPFTPIRLDLGSPPEGLQVPSSGVVRGESTPETAVPQGLPDEVLVRLLINADEASGFPVVRQGALDALAQADAVLVSGDIHASMLGANLASNGEKVIDFTAPQASSAEFRGSLDSALAQIEDLVAVQYASALSDPTIEFRYRGREEFLARIDRFVRHSTSELAHLNTRTHGYLVMEAGADSLRGEFREIRPENIRLDRAGDAGPALDALFTRLPYTVTKAEGDLDLVQEPPVLALSQGAIRSGENMALPGFDTLPEVRYRIAYATEVDAGEWTLLPAGDYVAADGALLDGGEILGSGNRVAVVFRIPEALSEAPMAFFRAEPVPVPAPF